VLHPYRGTGEIFYVLIFAFLDRRWKKEKILNLMVISIQPNSSALNFVDAILSCE
jgi:hypothetical protein